MRPIFLEVGFFFPIIPKKNPFHCPPGTMKKSKKLLVYDLSRNLDYLLVVLALAPTYMPTYDLHTYLPMTYLPTCDLPTPHRYAQRAAQHVTCAPPPAVGINLIRHHHCVPHRNCSRLSSHNLQLLAM